VEKATAEQLAAVERLCEQRANCRLIRKGTPGARVFAVSVHEDHRAAAFLTFYNVNPARASSATIFSPVTENARPRFFQTIPI
jgi:hypothetical protein